MITAVRGSCAKNEKKVPQENKPAWGVSGEGITRELLTVVLKFAWNALPKKYGPYPSTHPQSSWFLVRWSRCSWHSTPLLHDTPQISLFLTGLGVAARAAALHGKAIVASEIGTEHG